MLGRTAALLVLASLALPACGSQEEDAEPVAPLVDRKKETRQRPPDLPPGFERHVSRRAGLEFGRPPGWKVTKRGDATLLIAPDELVVMSLSADRTDEAVAADAEQLAVDTFAALEGYKGKLKPSTPRKWGHPYEAYQVRGDAVAKKTNVRQRVRVFVLEREGRTVVTAVIAENSKEKAPDEVRQAYQALRTLRTRPPAEPRKRSKRPEQERSGQERKRSDRSGSESQRSGRSG
jgi:hypothetical protein